MNEIPPDRGPLRQARRRPAVQLLAPICLAAVLGIGLLRITTAGGDAVPPPAPAQAGITPGQAPSSPTPPEQPSASTAPAAEGSYEAHERAERIGGIERIANRFAEEAEIGIAVAPLAGGAVRVFGELRTGRAWSAIKVPLVVAALSSGRPAGGRLDTRIQRALRRSDNEAAKALYMGLGDGGFDDDASRARLQETLDASGARIELSTQRSPEGRTETGTTEWRLAEATIFFRQLGRGCLLDPASTAYVMESMSGPISRQRWGAFSRPDAGPIAAKSGWGPDSADIYSSSTWLLEHYAIVGGGQGGYAVGLMARGPEIGAGIDAEPKQEFETFAPLRDGARRIDELAGAVIDQLGPAAEWPAASSGHGC